MTKQIIGAQGEVTIMKIDTLPENIETKTVERGQSGHIISHSESGHHHCLTGGHVMERTSDVPAGMRKIYAILEEPQQLIQDAPGKPHESYDLAQGIYEFRIAREYDPFAEHARIVGD